MDTSETWCVRAYTIFIFTGTSAFRHSPTTSGQDLHECCRPASASFSPRLKSEMFNIDDETIPNTNILPSTYTIVLPPITMLRRTICSAILWRESFRCAGSKRLPSQRQWRHITSTSRTRQSVAPTMQQLQAPFSQKNSSTAYEF